MIIQILAKRFYPQSVVLSLLCIFLGACDGAEEREAAYFKRGKALFESGETVKAQLEFKNVLQINPKNIEARFYLAKLANKQGNLRGAFSELSRLVSDNPKYLPAQVELGKLLFIVGRSSEALDKAKLVLSADPENAEAKALTAAIALNLGKLDEAEREASLALSWDSINVYAASVLASAQNKAGRPQEAIETLNRALKGNPDNLTLRTLKVDILVQKGDFAGAEAVHREVVKSNPDQVQHRMALAKFLVKLERLDDAERVVRDAVITFSANNQLKLYLITFLHKHRGTEPAEKQLIAFIDELPGEFEFRFALARLYQSQKATDRAKEIYQKVIALDGKGPNGIAARIELARLALLRGDTSAADALVTEVLRLEPENTKALLVRAGRFLSERKYLEAATDLRLVLRDVPSSKSALGMLAEAYIRSQKAELAKETLQTLVKIDPSNDRARVQLAQIHARSQEFDEGLRLVTEIADRENPYIPAIRVKVGLLVAKGRIEEAEQNARKYLRRQGQEALGHELLARVFRSVGRHDDAAREFQSVLDKDPTSVFAQVAVASSYLAAGNPAAARESLQKYVDESPDDPLAHELLGQVLVMQRDLHAAEREFLLSAELHGDWVGTYGRYARYLVSQRLYPPAIDAFLKALERAPGDERLLFDLAIAHQLAGDNASAIETYERLLAKAPNVDAAANNLAALISDYRYNDIAKLQRALRLSEKFKESRNPYFIDTLGWVHYRLGNRKKAQEILELAQRLGRSFASLHYHLGMVYFSNNQFEQARQQLSTALKGTPDFPGADEARSTLKALKGTMTTTDPR